MMLYQKFPPTFPNPTQTGGTAEWHVFTIPSHWWTQATIVLAVAFVLVSAFILTRKWTRKERAIIFGIAATIFAATFPQSLQTPGSKRVVFKQDYRAPIYWVWDMTDPKAPVRLIDKTYAHAADIIVEAPKGHLIRFKVAGR